MFVLVVVLRNLTCNACLSLDSDYDVMERNKESMALPGGIVEMEVNPSQNVDGNTTVIVTVSSETSFPEPR